MSTEAQTRLATPVEVQGPSAYGGGARRFFSLLWLIAVTDFKLTFLGTVLGYVWSLLRPLMLFAVLYLVFTQIFRFGDQVPHYPVFLLMNLMLFNFFLEATDRSVDAVLKQETIVRKMQFPRLVIPLSVVLTSFFNLCLNLVVVLGFMLASGVEPRWTWLLFPLIVAGFVVFAAAIGTLLSALYPRYRDMKQIWAVLGTLLFYASPVLYPASLVFEAGFQIQLLINPIAPLLEQANLWMIDPDGPVAQSCVDNPPPGTTASACPGYNVIEAAGSFWGWLGPGLVFVGLCVLAVWVFNRQAPRIAEEL
jgi:ABC-2 type transport system permease protein